MNTGRCNRREPPVRDVLAAPAEVSSYRSTQKLCGKKQGQAAPGGGADEGVTADKTRRRRRRLPCWLVTAAALILIFVGGVVLLLRAGDKMAPRCEQYLDAVDGNDYEAAYELLDVL